MLHGEHAGERRRPGGAAHDAGGHARGLAQPGPAHQDARILRGELQRGGRVEDDEGARPLVPGRAEQDLVDALGVVDVLVDRGDPLDGLVAQRQTGVRAAPRAHGLGEVQRLHAVAVEVDRRQLVAETGRRLEIVQRAGAHGASLDHVGRAGSRAEDAAVGAAERQAELGAAAGQHERRRRGGERRLHCAGGQVDAAAVAARSARAEQGDGLVVLHEDAGPLEHAQRALVDGGDRGRLRKLGAEAHRQPSGVNPSTSASMRADSSAGSGAGWCVSSSVRALRRAFSARSSPPSSCQRT